jgi:UPF0271 protein
MKRIDLNCDMGESFGAWNMGQDAQVMPWVSSANIACGMHAGDPATIQRTVALAVQHDVAIGAHVSLPDLQGFGRRAMAISAADLHALVLYQIGALAGFARAAGTRLHHVKAHGALYHQTASDSALAQAFARAVRDFDAQLAVIAQSGGALLDAAQALGLRGLREAFADRGYGSDGKLLARGTPGALLEPAQAAAQALAMAAHNEVVAHGNMCLPIIADTLCIHGDHEDAAALAQAVRSALAAAGISVQATTS